MFPAGYPPEWDEVVAPPEPRRRDHRAEWRRRKLKVYNKACELREWLRAKLGGRCTDEKCRATDRLEFHHPEGRDWEPSQKNLMQRMRLYLRDWKRGQLTLLCSPCNGRDGQQRGYWQRKRRKQPRRRR